VLKIGRLKKLHKLLYLSYVGPFVATFFIALFVLVVQFLFKWVDELIGKGLPADVLLQLVFYATLGLVGMALPLAVLLSSIMLFGGLAEHRELMGLKSAGISLLQVMGAMMPFLVLMMGVTFFLNNNLIPYANRKLGTLLIDIRQKKPAIDLPEGVFYGGIRGYTIRVAEKKEGGRLEGLMIYDHTERQGNTKVLLADSGRIFYSRDTSWMFVQLYHGIAYDEAVREVRGRQIPPFTVSQFEAYRMKIDIREFKFVRTNESILAGHYQAMPMALLAHYADSMARRVQARLVDFRKSLRPFFLFERDSLFWERMSAGPDTVSRVAFALPVTDKTRSRALNEAYSVQNLLNAYSTEITHYRKLRARYLAEWHRKLTLALAVIILFLIGGATGAIIRKGGLGMPTVVSVLLFIAFYLIDMTGYKMVKNLVVAPWLGIWLPIFVLAPVSILLLLAAHWDVNLLAWRGWRRREEDDVHH